MRKLFLTMSVAAAVAAGTAPMSVHAANLQGIVITNDKTCAENLQNLLEGCNIRLDELFQNVCPNGPGVDIIIPDIPTPESPAPEDTQPIPPATENTQPDTSVPEITPPDSSDSVHPYVLRVVELVNEERAKAGLNLVTLDTAASSAAQIRAKEIVSSFSHTRPNGSSFSTALKEQGVIYRSAGENIAYGQRSPEQVMEGWMNSAGHRANILNESFTHIGVGYHQENGVNYWTQLFFK